MKITNYWIVAGTVTVALTLSSCAANNPSTLNDGSLMDNTSTPATPKGNDKPETIIRVDITDAPRCTISPTTAASGTITFRVTNRSTKETEFGVAQALPSQVMNGWIKSISPGTSPDLEVKLKPGKYNTICGIMATAGGEGMKPFTVTGNDEPWH